MPIELPEAILLQVEPLFTTPHQRLVYQALAAGNTRGVVWVDDAQHPANVCLWNGGHHFYFSGNADRQEFAGVVAAHITCNSSFAVLHCASPGWKEALRDLFNTRAVRDAARRFYAFLSPTLTHQQPVLPAGYRIEPITRELFTGSALDHIDCVHDEITSMWNSVDDFLTRGFGYCAVQGNEIANWCTAEYVSTAQCGIGIETVEAHQRRGLATLTTTAFVQHCLRHGILPHWDCWTANEASWRVAEKVGFTRVTEYNVLVVSGKAD
ncbi:MAG: GNAT family N-acetyltransferase [Armatimonadota bacterium]